MTDKALSVTLPKWISTILTQDSIHIQNIWKLHTASKSRRNRIQAYSLDIHLNIDGVIILKILYCAINYFKMINTSKNISIGS